MLKDIFGVSVIVIAIMSLMFIAMEKSDYSRCLELFNHSNEFEGFYASQLEIEMCNNFNIKL